MSVDAVLFSRLEVTSVFIYGLSVRNNAEILSLSGSGSKGQFLAQRKEVAL